MEIKDAFGIGPLAEAAKGVIDASVDAASAFLSRICLPAAEEFGLLLKDRVQAWRALNAARIAAKAEVKLAAINPETGNHAHPRLVGHIIEQGSWADADEVQDMWAGLLASSCTEDGQDDSNLMFVDLLGRLSLSQVRILDHACKSATKIVTKAGWLSASGPAAGLGILKQISGLADVQRIDRELDHLRALGLLVETAGFYMLSTEANLTPSALALQMYARCSGHRADPIDFYRKQGNLIEEAPNQGMHPTGETAAGG